MTSEIVMVEEVWLSKNEHWVSVFHLKSFSTKPVLLKEIKNNISNNTESNSIEIKNISKFIRNYNLIEKEYLMKFDHYFYNLIVYLSVFNKYISRKMKKDLINGIINNFERIGINKIDIDLIINHIHIYIDKEISFDDGMSSGGNFFNKRIELFFYNINEYAVKRRIDINHNSL